MKEQNELLYDTKVVLEEQLTGLNTKEERIGEQISMGRVVRHIFAQVLTSDYFNGPFKANDQTAFKWEVGKNILIVFLFLWVKQASAMNFAKLRKNYSAIIWNNFAFQKY